MGTAKGQAYAPAVSDNGIPVAVKVADIRKAFLSGDDDKVDDADLSHLNVLDLGNHTDYHFYPRDCFNLPSSTSYIATTGQTLTFHGSHSSRRHHGRAPSG
ncbi:hypothetical protein LTR56_027279 [Elasticomyces elasticus]|nr:hypothetical protein LTR56_027279 [Elasticomyces elasticus]KAK4902401.1 hypothetical protein LTR49_027075 [Elasticomyces elasticus]KAK5735487.1 hypothetical protein LTS12_026456 [Elasticomyces elasticus]